MVVKHVAHDLRRKPLARLVEQHEAGRADQRARDRDHLHFAAGQVLAFALHQIFERREDLAAFPSRSRRESACASSRCRDCARRSGSGRAAGRPAPSRRPCARSHASAARVTSRAVEVDRAAARPCQRRGSSGWSWSCRRRWGRAGPTSRRARRRAKPRTAPASRRRTCRCSSTSRIMRTSRDWSACTQGFACNSRGVPARDHLAPMDAPRCGRRARTESSCRARSRSR